MRGVLGECNTPVLSGSLCTDLVNHEGPAVSAAGPSAAVHDRGVELHLIDDVHPGPLDVVLHAAWR